MKNNLTLIVYIFCFYCFLLSAWNFNGNAQNVQLQKTNNNEVKQGGERGGESGSLNESPSLVNKIQRIKNKYPDRDFEGFMIYPDANDKKVDVPSNGTNVPVKQGENRNNKVAGHASERDDPANEQKKGDGIKNSPEENKNLNQQQIDPKH